MRQTRSPPEYFSLRLAAFYATLGVATGVGMPFFPVWLEYTGLNPVDIGIILAIPMIVRVFSVPLTTRLADRFNMLRGAILIASIGSAIGNIAISLSGSFLSIALVMVAAAIFFTPTYPLADAYALRGLSKRGKAYGPVRLWSSAAYIAANVGSGLIIGIMPKGGIIWLITAAFTAGIVISWLMIPVSIHDHGAARSISAGKSLWRLPAFVAVVIACGAIQSSHAFYYGFSTLDWATKGYSSVTIGGFWAIGVIAEILLFAISGWLQRFVSPIVLVILGGIAGILRWTVMAFDPPFAIIPFAQVLHALTFGATLLGGMQFLMTVTPPGQVATAQGDLSAVQGFIFGAATGLSGWLFAAYGDLAYAAMAILAAIGLAGAVTARVFATPRTPA